MKICLINPPVNEKATERHRWYYNSYTMPNLGIGYIGAVLERAGYSVDILECPGQGLKIKDITKKVDEQKYDIIGIATFDYNLLSVIRMVMMIRHINPKAFIFLGGYWPTLNYDSIFNDVREMDCCVLGEGEQTCLKLIDAIKNGDDWRAVPGIAYKEEDGTIKASLSALYEELDSLPFPKRVYYSDNKYAALITSRGCYGKCTFCSISSFYKMCSGNQRRTQTPERSVAEIEYLANECGVENIFIWDNNFISNQHKDDAWFKSFCTLLADKNIKLTYSFMARANDIIERKEVLRELKKAGFDNIFIGAETLNARQLVFYNKEVTVQQNIEAIQIALELGMRVTVGFIMLDPFSTLEEIIENVQRLRSSGFYESAAEDMYLISMLYPVSAPMGTQIYESLKEKELLRDNELGYEFQDPNVAAFFNIARIWETKVAPVYDKFYLRQKAEKYGEADIEKALDSLGKRTRLVDMDFVEGLCFKLQQEQLTDEGIRAFIDMWEADIRSIKQEYEKYEAILSKYR